MFLTRDNLQLYKFVPDEVVTLLPPGCCMNDFVYMLMHKRKQAAHSFRKHGLTTTTRSELRAVRSQKISTDEYGVRFREPVSSRDVSLQKL
ncbi:hypothetical protein EOQ21_20165 [Salmonella bongori serovar 48:i:-]|nr:hypothetical protein [Salmonella bongori]ECE6546502.1 hypothetical protein [Salmonella bongori]ECG1192241.1 hypothetical protein [Salmonella bongori]ECG8260846.1 hypothetical protein [Salmonella bongori serovar 48:i:-]ECI3518353.1 hypothetical protein [Salmonella bongori]